MAMSSLSYCARLTRERDRSFYLCTLCAPESLRESWFALYGFFDEIGAIADKISEEMVGFVRYAWWRETLVRALAGEAQRGHPVAEALSQTARRFPLPQASLEGIIDLFEQAMAEKKPVGEEFLARTHGELFSLLAGGSAQSQPMAAHLGTAWGAMRAASLPQVDAEHRAGFVALAHEQLRQAGDITVLFRPFRQALRLHLRRLRAGKTGEPLPFAVPLSLWLTC